MISLAQMCEELPGGVESSWIALAQICEELPDGIPKLFTDLCRKNPKHSEALDGFLLHRFMKSSRTTRRCRPRALHGPVQEKFEAF